ncbi:MAG: Asp23/Gls24 family envelope stress response protein [Clostridia bacterium]|nr:Asp23/Gls24 family envelope stress response protein [Clostridia bacterium]
MEYKIKNEIGTIYINEDVMLKMVGYAVLECYGIVAMSSKRAKDGIVEWLGRENLSKGVQIRQADDMLDVDLFIVVEYGVSVAEVCKTIVEVVQYKLESMTGVKVRKVNISVEGIRV